MSGSQLVWLCDLFRFASAAEASMLQDEMSRRLGS